MGTIDMKYLFIEAFSIIISIIGFCSFVLIINLILKAHKTNLDYDKKRTVKYFKYLFITMAILDTLLVFNLFFDMGRTIITVIFAVRAIITVVTVRSYYLDIPKFSRKEIAISDHNKIINDVIFEFKNSSISEPVKKQFINKLENYKKT